MSVSSILVISWWNALSRNMGLRIGIIGAGFVYKSSFLRSLSKWTNIWQTSSQTIKFSSQV